MDSNSQQDFSFLRQLENLIRQRKEELPEGSYTTKLFRGGRDRILKKVGEEAAEVIIAAKNGDKAELIYESADLLYHLLVALVEQEVSLSDISRELQNRHSK